MLSLAASHNFDSIRNSFCLYIYVVAICFVMNIEELCNRFYMNYEKSFTNSDVFSFNIIIFF